MKLQKKYNQFKTFYLKYEKLQRNYIDKKKELQ